MLLPTQIPLAPSCPIRPPPVAHAPEGPLAGLTFAAKDLFDVAGYPTGVRLATDARHVGDQDPHGADRAAASSIPAPASSARRSRTSSPSR